MESVSRFRDAVGKQQGCPKSCSSHGQCIKGKCLCFAGFLGSDCSAVGACSGHGMPKVLMIESAGKASSCSCDPGWSGPDCGVQLLCPDQSCSGHGVCSSGKCTCGAGYSGHSCHIALISCEQRCGLHGSCSAKSDSGCACHDGWTGTRCEIKRLECESDCSGHGTCMGGFCSCHAPYEGLSCQRLSVLAKADSEKATATSLLSKKANGDSASALAKSNVTQTVRSTPSDAATALDGPMTASWLGRASWIRPASMEPANIKSEATKALSHDAIAPLDMTDAVERSRSSSKASILTLLSIGSSSRAQQTSGKTSAGWKERALDEGRSPQASLSKKLATLLVSEEGVNDMQQETATQFDNLDIDALLTNI